MVLLAREDDFDGWRDAARRLAGARVSPDTVLWQTADGGGDLFADPGAALPPEPAHDLRVPRAFPDLAESAILHSDPERFGLLYTLLLRLQQEPRLLEDAADPLVRRIEALAKTVRREIHKMHAFVRFREVTDDDGSRFVAWFEPDHHIVRATAGFFVRRFTSMRWSILTPELSIHWDGFTLTESAGADRAQAPAEDLGGDDALEALWVSYYRSIFNPARLKVGMMVKEMPRRYWKNLPEAQAIAPLIAGAQGREATMTAQQVAPAERPRTLGALAEEAQSCRRCPLWQGSDGVATGGCVFGEGPGDAKLMIVGEQPGDEEDRQQRAFVGPAGQLLDRALDEAQIERGTVYVTNAVKHFKFVMRGKRRLHQTPAAPEVTACRWWLDQEIGLLRPRATVMLGNTAIRGVTGKAGAVGALRGKPITLTQGTGIATYHPAYVLRVPDKDTAERAFADLVADLRVARLAADEV